MRIQHNMNVLVQSSITIHSLAFDTVYCIHRPTGIAPRTTPESRDRERHICQIGHMTYNLRERHYNKTLIVKTADLNERDFLIRNLYKGIY